MIPDSEAKLSPSAGRPQLQLGIGWPGSSRPSVGIRMWPSSPAIPAAPRTTRPPSTTPPPRPVPTISDTDERRSASAPKCAWWAYSDAALASLL